MGEIKVQGAEVKVKVKIVEGVFMSIQEGQKRSWLGEWLKTKRLTKDHKMEDVSSHGCKR